MFAHKRSWWAGLLLLAGLLGFTFGPALAQAPELRLSLARTMGYSSGGNIQGSFVVSASGPQDLASVTFFVDGKELATANQAPFRAAFATSAYAAGRHTLSATGQTSAGQALRSNDLSVNMLTTAQATQDAGRIIGPLLGIVLLVVVLATVGPAYLAGRANRRRAPGAARNYGLAGGAICPKCGRPFALAAFSPNMLTGKLVCCPYCRRWSVVRRASSAALAAAEAAEAAGAQPLVPELSEQEKLRRQIEDSRYH